MAKSSIYIISIFAVADWYFLEDLTQIWYFLVGVLPYLIIFCTTITFLPSLLRRLKLITLAFERKLKNKRENHSKILFFAKKIWPILGVIILIVVIFTSYNFFNKFRDVEENASNNLLFKADFASFSFFTYLLISMIYIFFKESVKSFKKIWSII